MLADREILGKGYVLVIESRTPKPAEISLLIPDYPWALVGKSCRIENRQALVYVLVGELERNPRNQVRPVASSIPEGITGHVHLLRSSAGVAQQRADMPTAQHHIGDTTLLHELSSLSEWQLIRSSDIDKVCLVVVVD